MSDENEQGGGVGFGGVVGGAAAGVGVGYYMDKRAANSAIHTALADPSATTTIGKKFTEVAKTDMAGVRALREQGAAVSAGKDALSGKLKLDSVSFAKDSGKNASHLMYMNEAGSRGTALLNANLPKDIKVGEVIKDQNIIKTSLKSNVSQAEKTLMTDARKLGGIKFGDGFRSSGGTGKAKVIAATVAAAVAGGYVVHKLVGGSHSNRVQAERQVQQDMGRA